MPPPQFPPEPQPVKPLPGKGQSKAAKARRRRKAAAESATIALTFGSKVDKLPAAPAPPPVSDPQAEEWSIHPGEWASSPVSISHSQSLPELSEYRFSTDPTPSPPPPSGLTFGEIMMLRGMTSSPPPTSPSSTEPVQTDTDGFIEVGKNGKPLVKKAEKMFLGPPGSEQARMDWWNGVTTPLADYVNWGGVTDPRGFRVATWVDHIKKISADPPETQDVTHGEEPKKHVGPKHASRASVMAICTPMKVPPKIIVRRGK